MADMPFDEPIHITIPGCAADPRHDDDAPEGVVIHRVPFLHPDDVTVIDGIPVTTVARTLVDMAETTSHVELRELFLAAWEKGLLDLDAVRASAARVEWRPSLALLHAVIEEMDDTTT